MKVLVLQQKFVVFWKLKRHNILDEPKPVEDSVVEGLMDIKEESDIALPSVEHAVPLSPPLTSGC